MRPYKRFSIVWVDPNDICYCTPASKWTDINQHEGRQDHPHAFNDRGYFDERRRSGIILDEDWDQATLLFRDLLEYKALSDHIKGQRPWHKSEYAARAYAWIKSGMTSRGYADPDAFLKRRTREIDALIASIRSQGVRPASGQNSDRIAEDDISVNVARNGTMLFNNRGHHRLAIATLTGCRVVPVQIVVRHSKFKASDTE